MVVAAEGWTMAGEKAGEVTVVGSGSLFESLSPLWPLWDPLQQSVQDVSPADCILESRAQGCSQLC